MSAKYKLIIFDMDGTLADRDGNLLQGVSDWFAQHGHDYKFALATNQGGVGLRYWMESHGFGKPEKYPTEESIIKHIRRVVSKLDWHMPERPMGGCMLMSMWLMLTSPL